MNIIIDEYCSCVSGGWIVVTHFQFLFATRRFWSGQMDEIFFPVMTSKLKVIGPCWGTDFWHFVTISSNPSSLLWAAPVDRNDILLLAHMQRLHHLMSPALREDLDELLRQEGLIKVWSGNTGEVKQRADAVEPSRLCSFVIWNTWCRNSLQTCRRGILWKFRKRWLRLPACESGSSQPKRWLNSGDH